MKMISELFIKQKTWFNFVSFLNEQSLNNGLFYSISKAAIPQGFLEIHTRVWKLIFSGSSKSSDIFIIGIS